MAEVSTVFSFHIQIVRKIAGPEEPTADEALMVLALL
jgi:hypothetical protein